MPLLSYTTNCDGRRYTICRDKDVTAEGAPEQMVGWPVAGSRKG